jgi:hypothetical protein
MKLFHCIGLEKLLDDFIEWNLPRNFQIDGFILVVRLRRVGHCLRCHHEQDLAFAETPPATKFPTRKRAFFDEFVNRARMDL